MKAEYGYWHVIKLYRRTKTTKYYLCRCVCGTERIICGSALRRGRTKSCGCRQEEHRKETMEQGGTKGRYHFWTKEEDAYFRSIMGDGHTRKELADMMNERFGVDCFTRNRVYTRVQYVNTSSGGIRQIRSRKSGAEGTEA